MLNRAPIFINGFNRGGTNLLQFLIAAHPNVCVLNCETHELFYGKSNEPIRKWFDRLWGLPIIVSSRQHMFYVSNLKERNQIPPIIGKYIDWLFFRSKMSSVMNRFKDDQGTKYSREEIKSSRLLCKNTNGVIFTSKELQRIYPDAIFISLVRNGMALCESYIRRGSSAQEFGKMYERTCQKMMEDEAALHNYYIVHFEDMLNDPIAFVKDIYAKANLDLTQAKKFGLKAKSSMDKDGVRSLVFGTTEGERVWVPLERLGEHLRANVDNNQIDQLKPEEIKEFLKYASGSMKHYGYL
ncbi:MAG: sulfotransferase [Chloroflexi bacterium]|nr:sulfotransferase [Chloroflexota bacterium]